MWINLFYESWQVTTISCKGSFLNGNQSFCFDLERGSFWVSCSVKHFCITRVIHFYILQPLLLQWCLASGLGCLLMVCERQQWQNPAVPEGGICSTVHEIKKNPLKKSSDLLGLDLHPPLLKSYLGDSIWVCKWKIRDHSCCHFLCLQVTSSWVYFNY